MDHLERPDQRTVQRKRDREVTRDRAVGADGRDLNLAAHPFVRDLSAHALAVAIPAVAILAGRRIARLDRIVATALTGSSSSMHYVSAAIHSPHPGHPMSLHAMGSENM
jgi:hypothetical protein